MSSRSPRLQLTLRAAELDLLRQLARKSDQTVSAYLRSKALGDGEAEHLDEERALVSLAALVAAEHALVLLERLLPGGASRSLELREDAVRAAEDRIQGLRQHLSGAARS